MVFFDFMWFMFYMMVLVLIRFLFRLRKVWLVNSSISDRKGSGCVSVESSNKLLLVEYSNMLCMMVCLVFMVLIMWLVLVWFMKVVKYCMLMFRLVIIEL